MAVNRNERKMVLYVRNPDSYLSRITDAKKRERFLKASKANLNSLVWVEMGKVGYERNAFKQFILDKIEKNKSQF